MKKLDLSLLKIEKGNYQNLTEMCKEIGENLNNPMNEDESMTLLGLLDMDDETVFKMVNHPKNTQLKFLYDVIKSRVENQFEYSLSPASIVFLAFISQTPGKAIMYLWYIQYKTYLPQYKSLRNTPISMEDMCKYIIPNGVLSAEKDHEIWQKQKVSYDSRGANMVDLTYMGKEMFEKQEIFE